MIHKNKLKNKLKNENELLLWHGTKSAIVDGISRQGFNRSYAGINGKYFNSINGKSTIYNSFVLHSRRCIWTWCLFCCNNVY